MDVTFYDEHDELYQHAKFGEDRTTRAGCSCENVVFVTMFVCLLPAGLPRSGKLPVLFLLTGQKIRFFVTQRRLVAPIEVNLCRTDGHLGPLGCAKFHVNRCRALGMRPPKYQKFPLFGKESPRRGDSLDRFPNFLGAKLITPIQISSDLHQRL